MASNILVFSLLLATIGCVFAQQFQFIHLSDVHYSSIINTVDYNSSTSCVPPSLFSTLEESDHHHTDLKAVLQEKGTLTTSGLYGRYGCDTNALLFQSLMTEMVSNQPNPDFILYTGDSVGHQLPISPWTESQVTFAKTIAASYPDTQFIPSIGNNDVFPDYNSQCSDNNLAFLAETWGQWIPQDQRANFTTRGSFATSPVEGLVVISLNTILYAPKNPNKFANPLDPCDQFAWLEQQLIEAQENNNAVYIIGHIFPGLDPFYLETTWTPLYVTTFLNILATYPDVVKAGFYGHIHRDEFRSIQTNSAPAPNYYYFPMFIGSSVTPVYVNNPSYKVYQYNAGMNITTFSSYFTDVYVSNLNGNATWSLQYEFSQEYLLTPQETDAGLNGATLNTLVNKLKESDTLYSLYDSHRTSNYLPDSITNLCLAQSITSDQFNNCINSNLIAN
ncbi:hypothetical protein CYY_000190 [Polysphondylium violaceum]|uniref:Calcineurin-like phosphoesterase domain-containing protein n=1 Tax=Polysphondylium violaceum TaxID=133409 RepID=A0A8J4Q588_9MYCE|nr:hypothetical protein CYY_000190 [Polysphondylium violaceum]